MSELLYTTLKVIKGMLWSFFGEKILAKLLWLGVEFGSNKLEKYTIASTNEYDDAAALALKEAIAMAKKEYYKEKAIG